MRCQCLEQGCIHVVFLRVGRRKTVLVISNSCSAHFLKRRSPLLLHFPTPSDPITPSQVWWSVPTLALKSPRRMGLSVRGAAEVTYHGISANITACLYISKLKNHTKTKETRQSFFRKKTNVHPAPPPHHVILVGDTSSHPVLHFYQVSSKYHERYSSYRVDMKSNSNTRRGDNSKSKKTRVVILVRNMSFHPVLHFYQVSSKYSKGFSCYTIRNQIQTQDVAITQKVRKQELSFLYITRYLILFYISTKYHQNIPKDFYVTGHKIKFKHKMWW